MNRKIKFIIASLFFLAISSTGLFAQQITKFAVVDTNRVYQAYFRNSQQLRNYETKKEEYQAEIDKRTEELLSLQQQKSVCDEHGDTAGSNRLANEISRKTASLTDYINSKNAELESLKNSLQNSNAFYRELYATLQRIAETGGYSMVLSLQDTNSILWYSPSVDITDDVISALGLKD